MTVKINGKPTLVREDSGKEKVNWVYLGVSGVGTILSLYVCDLAAVAFLGVHAFPFIKWVGVILGWFGI